MKNQPWYQGLSAAPPIALLCVAGNGSALVRLLQEGTCKLEELSSYGGEELQYLLEQCGIPFGPEDSRVSVGNSCGDRLWEQEG